MQSPMQSPGPVRVKPRTKAQSIVSFADLPPLPEIKFVHPNNCDSDSDEGVVVESDSSDEECDQKCYFIPPLSESPTKVERYRCERMVGITKDGTPEYQLIGHYKTIKEIAEVLGFTISKTYNIFRQNSKLHKIKISKLF